MKKWFLISVMVFAGFLTLPGRAEAQLIGCDSSYYVCDDGVWGEPGDWSSGGYGAGAFADCHDKFGCLNCTLTGDYSTATCGRVFMQNGYCKCTGLRVEERYGSKYPICSTQGWCSYR